MTETLNPAPLSESDKQYLRVRAALSVLRVQLQSRGQDPFTRRLLSWVKHPAGQRTVTEDPLSDLLETFSGAFCDRSD